jgi:hypothetical protein
MSFTNISSVAVDFSSECINALTSLFCCFFAASSFIKTTALTQQNLQNLSLSALNVSLTSSVSSHANSSYYGVLLILLMMLYLIFVLIKTALFETTFYIFMFVFVWVFVHSGYALYSSFYIKKTQ